MSGAGSPRQVVVVGLAETAPSVAEQIARLPSGPVVRGVVLLRPREDAPEGGSAGTTPILGCEGDLPLLHARFHFDGAVVTLPRAMDRAIERVRRSLESLGVRFIFHPAIQDALYCEPTRGAGGAMDYASLAGRTPGAIDARLARLAVAGKRVAVTGAGGSIGSELCRIVAAYEPAELVLIERSENALFEIDRELAGRFATAPTRALLHDVVDERGTRAVFARHRPEVVFHAAAHKHVPMMEDHPAHAVNNNVFGTKSVVDAALEFGAERFVLISTDKAVNPSSVMGATKRFAEHYVRSLGGGTRATMVRFGNVLGSSGSVLTVWARQIAAGRPVTITDSRMTRFFMTIPEAAALVVQSAGLSEAEAAGADVFVLDMGEPVRIVELAERFVRSRGLTPIFGDQPAEPTTGPCHPIVVTGIRPGEKLHEQLAHEAEKLRPTALSGVNAWAGPQQDHTATQNLMADLGRVRKSLDADDVLETIRKWTPTLGKEAVCPIYEAGSAVSAA